MILGEWLSKLLCHHEWELVEEHKEPGRVVAAAKSENMDYLHYHKVQRYRCRKCGAVRFEQIPLC